MPLIVLTGYPCSGLTHRAEQLSTLIEKAQDDLFASGTIPASKPRFKVHIVSTHDDSSNPRTVYDHARTEKQARGVAYARAKRMLGRDSFVILDGMNYIKGYRYQLWCEAKALGTTSCVVHVGTPIDQCVANNDARIRRENEQKESESQPEAQDKESTATDTPAQTEGQDTEPAYPPELLNNLIFRYEEPSTHSRWDKPLFTVPWEDAEPPIADIWTALTGIPHPSAIPATDDNNPDTTANIPLSNVTASLATTNISDTASMGTTATGAIRRPGGLGRPKIKPHAATVQAAATDSSALYSMEKRTSAIVTAIRTFTLSTPSAETALAQSDDPQGISIPVPESETHVFIPAHVATSGSTDELAGAGGILALPRLQRMRRQWIGLNRVYIGQNQGAGRGGLTADQIGDAFVRFLNSSLAGDD